MIVDSLLTIGELAERAGVPTSTVRFYEREGLLNPDTWVSGQRRYRHRSVRKLVFIGLLKDAGLSLEDVAGMLDADGVEDWKAIARTRLTQLDDEISRLQYSRSLLEASLLCRFDHPLNDCEVMGAEIDRRIDATRGLVD